MKITLNADLKPASADRLRELTGRLSKLDQAIRDEASQPGRKMVYCEIQDDDITHASYTEYLGLCWRGHWGAVLSPDILRHLVLCQVGQLVSESPEVFRRVFTAADDKQVISLPGAGYLFPLDLLAETLTRKLNMNAAAWLSKFSGSTRQSMEASIVALAQAASPYYDYSMYMCGIPHVRLQGTLADWQLLQRLLDDLFKTLMFCAATSDQEAPLEAWWENVQQVVTDVTAVVDGSAGAYELFHGMFDMQKCGSGSQLEVKGWVTKLYRKAPPARYPENYATNISFIDYASLSDKKRYRMYSGLLGSSLIDDELSPAFGKLVMEVPGCVQ